MKKTSSNSSLESMDEEENVGSPNLERSLYRIRRSYSNVENKRKVKTIKRMDEDSPNTSPNLRRSSESIKHQLFKCREKEIQKTKRKQEKESRKLKQSLEESITCSTIETTHDRISFNPIYTFTQEDLDTYKTPEHMNVIDEFEGERQMNRRPR